MHSTEIGFVDTLKTKKVQILHPIKKRKADNTLSPERLFDGVRVQIRTQGTQHVQVSRLRAQIVL